MKKTLVLLACLILYSCSYKDNGEFVYDNSNSTIHGKIFKALNEQDTTSLLELFPKDGKPSSSDLSYCFLKVETVFGTIKPINVSRSEKALEPYFASTPVSILALENDKAGRYLNVKSNSHFGSYFESSKGHIGLLILKECQVEDNSSANLCGFKLDVVTKME